MSRGQSPICSAAIADLCLPSSVALDADCWRISFCVDEHSTNLVQSSSTLSSSPPHSNSAVRRSNSRRSAPDSAALYRQMSRKVAAPPPLKPARRQRLKRQGYVLFSFPLSCRRAKRAGVLALHTLAPKSRPPVHHSVGHLHVHHLTHAQHVAGASARGRLDDGNQQSVRASQRKAARRQAFRD